MSESIYHDGIVEKIDGNTLYVRIVQQSACSGCHAKAMCAASEQKDKIIEIADRSGQYQPGEKVRICGRSSLGLQAVFLAFVVPIFLILAALAAASQWKWTDTAASVTCLILLAAYYGLLYLLRDRLKKRFTFTVEKLNR